MNPAFLGEISRPDERCLELFRRTPELGPTLLFFSGGTALKETSEELVRYTHNSIHIVTATDSGGSSAELRRAFHMPAIGDLRQRLLTLADQSWRGNPAVRTLFGFRLDKSGEPQALRDELLVMTKGIHPLVKAVLEPQRAVICHLLEHFAEHMPESFNLRGASIGNLVLTGGYLSQNRQLDPVIYMFSQLVRARGTVALISNEFLHLAACCASGRIVVGQHLLTGKETPPLNDPIERIFLTRSLHETEEISVNIEEKIADLIAYADLICYPMGSFYSSLLVNFLPAGVGAAICANPCPKVFIPSTGQDPELFGKTLSEQVEELLACLRKDDPEHIADSDVLNFVLLDETADYAGTLDEQAFEKRGISVVHRPLVSSSSRPLIDSGLLVPLLVSLACK
ncbi:MAG: GAK system CofD-like protein [Deltaproteobacteria bacterium]|nr:GAK system CofD-like protein [Deltaproteobacteria bacterium]